MKIFYIAPCRTSFPSMAASSIHIMKMCEAFTNLGHEVCLVISKSEKSKSELFDSYGIKSRFKIHQIGIPTAKIGNVIYALKAASYVKSNSPDTVIGRSVSSLSLLCKLKVNTTIDLHGPIWEYNKLDYLLFLNSLRSDFLKKITVNSQALKDMYIEKKIYRAHDIIVAHNGSDPFYDTTYPEDMNDFFSSHKINIGYFGSLYQGRGVDLIIQLAEYNQEMDFHLFGGSDIEVVSWRAKTNSKNIYFHGHVSHEKVPYLRQYCDVLLAPYSSSGVAVSGGGGDSSKYMNPIKIVEYMSSGKAILTSDLPALRELLGSEGAIFADPNRIKQWQDALVKLKNESLRSELGSNALKRFNKGLTWEARAKKLLYTE